MKKLIAVPSSNGMLDEHFGHCHQFALLSVEDDIIISESTINLRSLRSLTFTGKEALSIGTSPNDNSLVYQQIKYKDSFPASVISYQSAIMSDKIFDSSILQLREIKNILDANKQTPIYEEAKTGKGLLVSKNV